VTISWYTKQGLKLKRLNSRIIALLLAIAVSFTGCASFIVRQTDGPVMKTVKITSRTVGLLGTLGGSEVYIYAAKMNEAIARTSNSEEIAQLSQSRDNAIQTYWVTIVVLATAGLTVAALASDKGGSSASPYRARQCTIHTAQGTCSYHGGVAACNAYGIAVCADGQLSPGYQECTVTCP
jgi:hypothetical protein